MLGQRQFHILFPILLTHNEYFYLNILEVKTSSSSKLSILLNNCHHMNQMKFHNFFSISGQKNLCDCYLTRILDYFLSVLRLPIKYFCGNYEPKGGILNEPKFGG